MTVHYYRADDKYTACHCFITYDLKLSRVVEFVDCEHCQYAPVFEDAQAASMEEALMKALWSKAPLKPGATFLETLYPSDLLDDVYDKHKGRR